MQQDSGHKVHRTIKRKFNQVSDEENEIAKRSGKRREGPEPEIPAQQSRSSSHQTLLSETLSAYLNSTECFNCEFAELSFQLFSKSSALRIP